MLTNHGSLNQEQFLSPQTVKEITSPHTQLENDWGYNGYNHLGHVRYLRKLELEIVVYGKGEDMRVQNFGLTVREDLSV